MSALVAKLLIVVQTAGLALVPGACWAIGRTAEAPELARTCCQRPADDTSHRCSPDDESQVRCCCQLPPAILPVAPDDDAHTLSAHPLWIVETLATPLSTAVRSAPCEVAVDWCGPARQARLGVWRL